MAVEIERNSGTQIPPAIYDAEALLGGHAHDGHGVDGSSDGHASDGDGTLHLLQGAIKDIETEADETARLERLEAEQRQAAMQQMSGMLRSILAERMVSAPAEELDATDALRAARKKVYGSSSLPDKSQVPEG